MNFVLYGEFYFTCVNDVTTFSYISCILFNGGVHQAIWSLY